MIGGRNAEESLSSFCILLAYCVQKGMGKIADPKIMMKLL